MTSRGWWVTSPDGPAVHQPGLPEGVELPDLPGALCAEVDPDLWFPNPGDSAEAAGDLPPLPAAARLPGLGAGNGGAARRLGRAGSAGTGAARRGAEGSLMRTPTRVSLGLSETDHEADREAAAYDHNHEIGQRLATANNQALAGACADLGVELGARDRRVMASLAGWEPEIVARVVGWMVRAYRSGRNSAERHDQQEGEPGQ